MAARIVWSQQALEDINAIAEYIHRDSPYHARRIVEQLFDLAETLVDHPELGRKIPELNDEKLRERFLYSYRLLYEIQDHQELYTWA